VHPGVEPGAQPFAGARRGGGRRNADGGEAVVARGGTEADG